MSCSLHSSRKNTRQPFPALVTTDLRAAQNDNLSRDTLRVVSNLLWFSLYAGVTADLDPPGPNPLADMDPLSRIWTPLKTSVLLSKIGKIVFWSCYHHFHYYATFLFKTLLSTLQYASVNHTLYGKCVMLPQLN